MRINENGPTKSGDCYTWLDTHIVQVLTPGGIYLAVWESCQSALSQSCWYCRWTCADLVHLHPLKSQNGAQLVTHVSYIPQILTQPYRVWKLSKLITIGIVIFTIGSQNCSHYCSYETRYCRDNTFSLLKDLIWPMFVVSLITWPDMWLHTYWEWKQNVFFTKNEAWINVPSGVCFQT